MNSRKPTAEKRPETRWRITVQGYGSFEYRGSHQGAMSRAYTKANWEGVKTYSVEQMKKGERVKKKRKTA